MQKRLSILIKPTDNCNLRCLYCYHSEYGYSEKNISIETYEQIIRILAKDYDSLHFIWHGGEPLLMPIEFYQDVIRVNETYEKKGLVIKNSVQTNGTLLTQDYCDLLLNSGFNIGFSFDGEINDITRKGTEATEHGMGLVRSVKQKVGAIKVVTSTDIENIIKCYKYYNDRRINLKLNYLFSTDECDFDDFLYRPVDFSNALKNLFDYWINDSECVIKVDPLETYISMALGKHRGACSYSSCIMKFIGVNYKGDIYPCSRYYPDEYVFGNFMEINEIGDAFLSDPCISFMSKAVKRRNKCIENCELFNFCHGGCNHDALIDKGLENNGFFSCKVFRDIFPYIKSHIDENELIDTRNKKIQALLNEKDS